MAEFIAPTLIDQKEPSPKSWLEVRSLNDLIPALKAAGAPDNDLTRIDQELKSFFENTDSNADSFLAKISELPQVNTLEKKVKSLIINEYIHQYGESLSLEKYLELLNKLENVDDAFIAVNSDGAPVVYSARETRKSVWAYLTKKSNPALLYNITAFKGLREKVRIIAFDHVDELSEIKKNINEPLQKKLDDLGAKISLQEWIKIVSEIAMNGSLVTYKTQEGSHQVTFSARGLLESVQKALQAGILESKAALMEVPDAFGLRGKILAEKAKMAAPALFNKVRSIFRRG